MRSLIGLTLGLSLFVALSLPGIERVSAKGMLVDPAVATPGSEVSLTGFFPGVPPSDIVTVALVPKDSSLADCSADAAKVPVSRAEGVAQSSWELAATITVPRVMTCAGGASVPLRAGMYFIVIGDATIQGQAGSEGPFRASFAVPSITGGIVGTGFSNYWDVTGPGNSWTLTAEQLAAFNAGFPGSPVLEAPPDDLRSDPLVFTFSCSAGCPEDPVHSRNDDTLHMFYFPRFGEARGVIAFTREGPFYRIDPDLAAGLNSRLGTASALPVPVPEEPPVVEAPAPTRGLTPYVTASVAGGLALAAGAFAVGVLVGRRRSLAAAVGSSPRWLPGWLHR